MPLFIFGLCAVYFPVCIQLYVKNVLRFFYIYQHLKVTQLLTGLTIRFSQSEIMLISNLQIL